VAEHLPTLSSRGARRRRMERHVMHDTKRSKIGGQGRRIRHRRLSEARFCRVDRSRLDDDTHGKDAAPGQVSKTVAAANNADGNP